ncbi:hypothetical protein SSPH_04362 [Sporomusa sphaeroides DSM 2875]|uniref:SAF domain-containing protein n=2 Tax=Sporomusa TaxID=2375 RepID=A0ABP2CCF3_9FIRM|nr:hypothetical protein SSPH_04362 [Sporomusa sphaeroides DSM 2875]
MNFFRHKSKGISGIVVGLLLASSLMVGLVAGGIKYLSAVHVGTAAAKTDAQVLYVAQSKMELAKAIDYDKLDLAAESRTAYADTGFETEVSIGDEVEIDENTKKRDITVKVYKPSGTVPLFKLTYLKPLTAQGSGNKVAVLTGVISHGQTVPLPEGFTESECTWVLIPRVWHNSKTYGYDNQFYFNGRKAVVISKEGTTPTATYIVIGIKK